jgi:type IV fimbrial biogenesis protein FimT
VTPAFRLLTRASAKARAHLPPLPNHERGFTLIELIITIIVGSVVVALAVPSFQTMIASNRTTALANEMVIALNLARSEAIKRGAGVSICRSNGGATCNGTSWAQGWIVFVDDNRNGILEIADGDELLRAWDAVKGDPVIAINPSATASIRYGNLGSLVATGGTVTISVSLPGCQGTQRRDVQVNPAGRINMTKHACPS